MRVIQGNTAVERPQELPLDERIDTRILAIFVAFSALFAAISFYFVSCSESLVALVSFSSFSALFLRLFLKCVKLVILDRQLTSLPSQLAEEKVRQYISEREQLPDRVIPRLLECAQVLCLFPRS